MIFFYDQTVLNKTEIVFSIFSNHCFRPKSMQPVYHQDCHDNYSKRKMRITVIFGQLEEHKSTCDKSITFFSFQNFGFRGPCHSHSSNSNTMREGRY